MVRTGDGSRLLYAEEAAEVWFSDYGFGQLQDGSAIITIDPVFAETVNLQERNHVFVEEYGPEELNISQRTPEWFEVQAHKRNADTRFSYGLVARRLGFEGQHLERAPYADNDPNMYSENQAEATWSDSNVVPEVLPTEALATRQSDRRGLVRPFWHCPRAWYGLWPACAVSTTSLDSPIVTPRQLCDGAQLNGDCLVACPLLEGLGVPCLRVV